MKDKAINSWVSPLVKCPKMQSTGEKNEDPPFETMPRKRTIFNLGFILALFTKH